MDAPTITALIGGAVACVGVIATVINARMQARAAIKTAEITASVEEKKTSLKETKKATEDLAKYVATLVNRVNDLEKLTQRVDDLEEDVGTLTMEQDAAATLRLHDIQERGEKWEKLQRRLGQIEGWTGIDQPPRPPRSSER